MHAARISRTPPPPATPGGRVSRAMEARHFGATGVGSRRGPLTVVRSEPSIALDLPAMPGKGAQARKAVAELAAAVGAHRAAVELAVGEAFGNAVLHAYRDRPPGTISVRAGVDRDELEVTVADDGIGMSPNPQSQGLGFGLPLIARVAHRVEITAATGGGTEVRMRFRLDQSSIVRGG
jgi:anti-sigma regulatory factor (Ser/Thr protein kinase)